MELTESEERIIKTIRAAKNRKKAEIAAFNAAVEVITREAKETNTD